MKLYILIQQLLRRKFVQYFVLFFILISIIAVIASSFEEMATYKVLLFGITYVSSFIFLIEYTARIVSAPALYPGMKTAKARLKYTFSFYGFVDFVAVLPCVLTYAYWDTEVVHVIILPYIFIIFKLIRHSRSFWWAIITFATVGYGDIYPITFLGKLLGCIICLVGVAMVAIPTGIISSSFINIVQKKEQREKFNKEEENR